MGYNRCVAVEIDEGDEGARVLLNLRRHEQMTIAETVEVV
jgi:hypothetical protein